MTQRERQILNWIEADPMISQQELADRAGITLGTTGMYKAGRDMEPGTYRITPLTFGSGYYALYNDVRYYYDYIDEYAALFEPVTVNIAEGQYLELFDAGSIERVSD